MSTRILAVTADSVTLTHAAGGTVEVPWSVLVEAMAQSDAGLSAAYADIYRAAKARLVWLAPNCEWVVVDNGRVVSGHTDRDAADLRAKACRGVVLGTPTTPRGFAHLWLHVGQRVTESAGVALPV